MSGLLTYTDAAARMASMAAAEERRMGWLVGALSQKRLVKHAINNETFCLSASRAVSRSLLPFVRSFALSSPESSLGVRIVAVEFATFLLFLIIKRRRNWSPI